MSMHKQWRDCTAWKEAGLPISTTSNEACKLFDAALTQYVGWYDDPVLDGLDATVDNLVHADPENVMAYVLRNGLTVISAASPIHLDPEFRNNLETMIQLADKNKGITDWERQHVKAVALCGQGDMPKACDVWETILVNHPQDLLALKFAHDGYFVLGRPHQMRDSVARVMPQWKTNLPLYSYLFGMYSFGLCETNLYSQAEKIAKQGVEMNSKDAYSAHSLAHVFEMCGRQEEGISFLSRMVSDWSYCDMLACHNFWHWALYHIEMGEYQAALDILDSEVCKRALSSASMFNIVDACSLLCRLEMEGVDVDERWHNIFELCKSHTDDHAVAFNDVHLLMAYIGADHDETVKTFMDSLNNYIRECSGHNHMVTKELGVHLCEALIAYNSGQYADVVDILHPLRYKLIDIGGSNAQRDIFNQFLIHAALKSSRCTDHKLARSLLMERKAIKENAPLTDRLIAKALV